MWFQTVQRPKTRPFGVSISVPSTNQIEVNTDRFLIFWIFRFFRCMPALIFVGVQFEEPYGRHKKSWFRRHQRPQNDRDNIRHRGPQGISGPGNAVVQPGVLRTRMETLPVNSSEQLIDFSVISQIFTDFWLSILKSPVTVEIFFIVSGFFTFTIIKDRLDCGKPLNFVYLLIFRLVR